MYLVNSINVIFTEYERCQMRKEKRFLMVGLVLFATLALASGSAFATQFNMNLDTITAGYGNYTNIYAAQYNGNSAVTQDYGPNGVFSNGDTFTERSFFQEITYTHSDTGTSQALSGLSSYLPPKILFIYAGTLSGTVNNVQASGAFNYTFNSGTDIGMYIADDTGALPTSLPVGAQKVADLSFVKGDGAGLDTFLGGQAAAGSTRLTVAFTNATPDGVWSALGLDLGNLPAGITAQLLFNTTNTVQSLTPTFDANNAPTGFTAVVKSTGDAVINVVPEPSTMLLLGLGLIFLSTAARKRFFGKEM
jgi:hypothetical protein